MQALGAKLHDSVDCFSVQLTMTTNKEPQCNNSNTTMLNKSSLELNESMEDEEQLDAVWMMTKNQITSRHNDPHRSLQRRECQQLTKKSTTSSTGWETMCVNWL
jgi:CRISPR/Cas system type I-B associated protein Csh2 (Cas7 group RAMP superfamily)